MTSDTFAESYVQRTELVCNDFGDELQCLRTPDPQYTMRFDDIGHPPIYWCAFCGPRAAYMQDVIMTALDTRGPEFQEELKSAIADALAAQLKQ
jgi:hypothetical protein